MTIIYEYTNKKFFNWHEIIVLIFVIIAGLPFAHAQNSAFYALPGIRSLSMKTLNDSLTIPSVALGTDEILIVEFDELDADSRSLSYSLRHCNADWQPSDLMDIEFFDGFNRVYGHDAYHLSFNTTTDYTHYVVKVEIKDIKISGNYVLTLIDDDDTRVLSVPFLVYENMAGIRSRITRSRSGDCGTQKLSFSILHPQIHTTNPMLEFSVVVWQNSRDDTRQILNQPTFVRSSELVFLDAASFDAGNEHRWADNRSLKYNGLNVASVDFYDPYYHVTLDRDAVPVGYFYHEDFNARSHFEARDIHRSASYAADYTFVHFSLATPPLDGKVYVFGQLSDFAFSDASRMSYDEQAGAYKLSMQMKQGLHSYQYVVVDDKGRVSTADTEGSFADTENDYFIAVYYRPQSETHDRLIAFKRHNSMKTINDFIK